MKLFILKSAFKIVIGTPILCFIGAPWWAGIPIFMLFCMVIDIWIESV